MRKVKFLILVLIICSCQKKSEKIQFSGTVLNNTQDYALLVTDSTGIGLSVSVDTIRFDKNGEFNFESNSLKTEGLLIFPEREPFQLIVPRELSSSIKIELNLLNPDSLKIFGKQSPFIQYTLDEQKYHKSLIKTMSIKHPVIALNNNSDSLYHKIQDTVTNMRINYLKNYFEESSIDRQEEFIKSEENSLIFSNLYYRMSGQEFNIVRNLGFYKDSDNPLTYSETINFNDLTLFYNKEYLNFINDAILTIVRYENPNSDLSSYELYLHKGFGIIDNLYNEDKANRVQKMIFVKHLLDSAELYKSSIDISEFSKMINTIRNSENQDYVKLIDLQLRSVENSMAKFAVGKVAPDFEVENIERKKVNLSDFKHKLILIDVWASWCGPCINSFPKWNTLNKKYFSPNEIVFLTVSLDKDRDKWEDALNERKLCGLKLYSGAEAFESHFATSYEIRSIPTYIAIDENGLILSISSGIDEIEKTLFNRLSR